MSGCTNTKKAKINDFFAIEENCTASALNFTFWSYYSPYNTIMSKCFFLIISA